MANTHAVDITNNASLNPNGNDNLVLLLNNITDNHFWSNVRSDGGDIRMSYFNGSSWNQIAVDLVYINTASHDGEIHFDASSGSANTSNKWRIEYGDPSLAQPPSNSSFGRNNVWNTFEAVFHLQENPVNPAPQFIDSTGNGYDGYAVNGPTSSIQQLGNGLTFNEAGQEYVSMSALPFPSSSDFTLTLWADISSSADTTSTDHDAFIGQGLSSGGPGRFIFYSVTSFGTANGGLRLWGGGSGEIIVGSDIRGTGKRLVTLRRSGSIFNILLDGVLDASASATPTFDVTDIAHIGDGVGTDYDRWYDGGLDEVRVVNGQALTDNYIIEEYNVQSNNSTFWTASVSYQIISGSFIQVADTGQSFDALNNLNSLTLVSENGAGIENNFAESTASVYLQETSSASDNNSLYNSFNIQDYGTSTDVNNLFSDLNVRENSIGNDTPYISADVRIQESSTSDDIYSILSDININDFGTSTELISVIKAAFEKLINISDTSIATDLISVGTNVILIENSIGNEFLNQYVQLNINDVQSSQENINSRIRVNVTDTASTFDLERISDVIFTINDLSNNIDSFNVLADIQLNESSISSDSLNVINVNLYVYDNSTSDEIINSDIQLNVSDFETSIELLSVIKNRIVSIFDTGNSLDDINSIIASTSVSDDGNIDEFISFNNIRLNISDISNGIGEVSIDASVDLNDISTSNDALEIVLKNKFIRVVESAIGSDNISNINIDIQLTEQGYYNELSTIENILSVIENGYGVESILSRDSTIYLASVSFIFNYNKKFNYKFETNKEFEYDFKSYPAFSYKFNYAN